MYVSCTESIPRPEKRVFYGWWGGSRCAKMHLGEKGQSRVKPHTSEREGRTSPAADAGCTWHHLSASVLRRHQVKRDETTKRQSMWVHRNGNGHDAFISW